MADAWGKAAGADPFSVGLMAAGSVATAAMSKPPMNAQQTAGGATFDNSGWNVNIGAGATQSASTSKATGTAAALTSNPLLLLAIVAGIYFMSKR